MKFKSQLITSLIKEKTRSIFYKKKATRAVADEFSISKALFYLLILGSIYFITGVLSGVEGLFEAKLTSVLKDNINLINLSVHLFIFLMAYIHSSTFYFDNFISEYFYLRSFPLSKRNIIISKLSESMFDVGGIFIFLIWPTVIIIFGLSGLPFNTIYVYSFYYLLFYLIYLNLNILIHRLIIKLVKSNPLKISGIILSSVFAVLFFAILPEFISISKLDLYQVTGIIENNLKLLISNEIIRVPFLIENVYALVLVPMAAVFLTYINTGNLELELIGPENSDILPARQYDKLFNRQNNNRLTIFLAYFKKDFINVIRGPKDKYFTFLFFIVSPFFLIKIFSPQDNLLILSLIYSFPIIFSGSLILYSVGNEGSNIYYIKMITTIRKYLKAKTISSFFIVLPATLIIFGIYYAIFLKFILAEFIFRLFFIMIITFISVKFTISISTLFADFNVKRMFKDRGITITGEIIFYFSSWLIFLPGAYFDHNILQDGSYLFTSGLMFLIILIAIEVIYIVSRKSLEAENI